MENSQELKQLIRENADLFWYTQEAEKENLELAVILEFFINYADKETIKSLFKIVGEKEAARVFFEQQKKWGERSNYFPELNNFFTLYFNRNAS